MFFSITVVTAMYLHFITIRTLVVFIIILTCVLPVLHVYMRVKYSQIVQSDNEILRS